MDVEAVVSIVIRKLTDLLIQEPIISKKAIDEIELVRISLRQMQNFLIDAEDTKENKEAIKKWVDDFLAVVYKVEDAIDTFVLPRMYARRVGFVGRYFFILKNLKADTDLRNQIEEINKKIKKLDKIRSKTFKESNNGEPLTLRIRELTSNRSNNEDEGLTLNQQNNSLDREPDIIGFEEDKIKLVAMLTGQEKLHVISVEGTRGSGKTTLATAIYNSDEVKDHFDCRAWVKLASGNSKELLLSIWEQIGGVFATADSHSDRKELVEKLSKNLQEKRYLVVLDDVRTIDEWKELCDAFPVTDKGAKFHEMKPLNDEKAWELLLKMVRLPNNFQFKKSEIFRFKRKIRRRCKGLPLAIVVLGGLLSTKDVSYQVWLRVFERIDSKESQLSDISALSYIDLPFYLRPCFLYFRLFPKDYDIPVRRLLRLWLAEGFVYQSPGKTPEDMADEYLKQLLKRKLIQISKQRKDGSPKTCRMLSVLHDDSNFLSKAREIGLFHIPQLSGTETTQHGVRRVADYGYTKEYSSSSDIEHLRSYLSFNIQKNDIPVSEIESFLNKFIGQGFGLLRVLDLERVYKPKFPKNLGKLFHLRYFGLRWTSLDSLPHSVGELPYLETLDLKHTRISSLPSSIWKMKYLRHLCLDEIRLDMSLKKHGTYLTRLQTLWGLFVDDKTLVKNGLYGLINLRKLGLTCHLESFQELNEWIARLASLQSLKIRSKNQNGQPWKLNLKPLSSLENLTHLYLLGSLPELHDRYEFPPKLTVLTLSVSKLEKDPMPILAQLPSLSVLRLLADSYTGKELKCPPKGFIKLQILKLWMLKDLETWEVGKEALNELQEVEIRCCDKLKELPAPLFILENIKKIVLTNMPQKFVDEIPARGLIFPKTLQF
nr:putative disease resistance protein [Quercus suber]